MPKYSELRHFLLYWRDQFTRRPTPEKFVKSLSRMDVAHYRVLQQGHEASVTAFRHLNTAGRIRVAKKVLEEWEAIDARRRSPIGLTQKYVVHRRDGPGKKHGTCTYFVLDWEHDPYALPAALAYADACEKELPRLAQDLRIHVAQIKRGEIGAVHETKELSP